MLPWTASATYSTGDAVMIEERRSALAIWLDRVRLWRWNVPKSVMTTLIAR